MPWDTSRPGSNPVYRTREYRAAKAAATKAYKQGDPCWHCGQPMHTDKPSSLPLEHRGSPATHDFVPLGLSHKPCNDRDGARKGRARQETRVTTIRW